MQLREGQLRTKHLGFVRKYSLFLAILGVVMYCAVLFFIYAVEYRTPDRFEQLRMPNNAFLKIRFIVSAVYLLLLPAIFYLVRIYQQLTDYFKGVEEAIIGFYKSLRYLFLSLLLAWVVFVIFVVVAANYLMGYQWA